MGFRVPLYYKQVGEAATKVELRLTQAKSKFVVRVTGGCGYMDTADGCGLVDLFQLAFYGFTGALIGGGTRIVSTNDPKQIHQSIGEVGPAIRELCPGSIVLGVVPRPFNQEVVLTDYGLVVSHSDEWNQDTIIHPLQDECLIVQHSADDGVKWEAEYQECLEIIHRLREFAAFRSLLICYNGGMVTEKEILATAGRGWPVILIAGSGRMADKYAQDKSFLEKYPNVTIVSNDPVTLRQALIAHGAIELALNNSEGEVVHEHKRSPAVSGVQP